jgi:hypothetical protein
VTAKKADKKPSREEQAIAAIKQLGGQARTAQIIAVSGMPHNSVPGALQKALARGDVVACKVKTSSGNESMEYRIGSGVPDSFRPLNTGRRVSFGNRMPSAGAPPAAPVNSIVRSYAEDVAALPRKPAARTVATRNDEGIAIEINSDASLRIVKGGNVSLMLNPEQVLALGDFLHATEGLWRP